MFEHIRTAETSDLLVRQSPPLVVSLVVADQFFHFGRFAPECLAFLGLWFGLDRAWNWLLSVRNR